MYDQPFLIFILIRAVSYNSTIYFFNDNFHDFPMKCIEVIFSLSVISGIAQLKDYRAKNLMCKRKIVPIFDK